MLITMQFAESKKINMALHKHVQGINWLSKLYNLGSSQEDGTM